MHDDRTRRISPTVVLTVVGFSVFVAADDLMVVTTMLRPIIGDLGLKLPDGLDDAAWIVNAYLIAFVAVMPIAGRISDVIGRRRTFMGAYAVFLAGTVLIPLSVSFDHAFGWFLAGRVMTAVGGGAMLPVALAVVGDAYPAGRRARALGTLGAIETLGWVWGPLYGAMLVRFLSWEWQFWLNIPFAIGGMVASWVILGGFDRPVGTEVRRVDVLGAGLLTGALVSLCVGLLGPAEIQSVNGLDELTGGSRAGLRWFLVPAVVASIGFVWRQRRAADPILDPALLRGPGVRVALGVTFVIGGALVIAMVDTPLFVNAIETDIERAAVTSGWILSALTATMAITSYLGGRVTERTWARPPVLIGCALAAVAFVWMGSTWAPATSELLLALQLGVLGAGIGLTFAPTTAAVVDAAPADRRGAAAAMVMVVRLLGLSVGLAALTAWALARFEALRSTVELPAITEPEFADAVLDAQATLTAQSIAETFLAAAVVVGVGFVAGLFFRRSEHGGAMTLSTEPEQAGTELAPPAPTAPASRIGSRGVPMLIGVLALLIAVLASLAGVLFGRLSSTEDRIEAGEVARAALEAELDEVRAGAALVSAQLTGFQAVLGGLGPEVSTGLDEAIAGLRTFGGSTLSFTVAIDEEIPISTEFAIRRDVVVPINTSIPITETVDTTIEVDGPFGITVPVDVSVPVDITVPIDLEVTIPVDEVIPVDETFSVELDVPIDVDVGDTELAGLADSLVVALESVRSVLGTFG